MATTIKTVMTYPLDGSTTDFNIPFEYLARKFVRVTLIGVDRKELILNQDYRFATKTTISTTRALGPADGYNLIEIRRYTSATERLVDFTDGSILRAYDLNISQVQTLHVAEEARDLTADTIGVNNDGNLDARGRRIVNVADGVTDGDAISVGQVKRMNQNSWQARNESLQFRNEAEGFRNQTSTSQQAAAASESQSWNHSERSRTFAEAAQGSANSAGQSATNANNAMQSAGQSATDASNSAAQAKTSEINAKASEINAKRDADAALLALQSTGNVPVGTVAMITHTKIPTGWVRAGEDFDVNTYPALAELFPSGRTPSFDDRYPIGNSTVLSPGQLLDQSVPAHSHTFDVPVNVSGATAAGGEYRNRTSHEGDHSHSFALPIQNNTGAYTGRLVGGGNNPNYPQDLYFNTGGGGAHSHEFYVPPHSHTLNASGRAAGSVSASGIGNSPYVRPYSTVVIFIIKAAQGVDDKDAAMQVVGTVVGRVDSLENWQNKYKSVVENGAPTSDTGGPWNRTTYTATTSFGLNNWAVLSGSSWGEVVQVLNNSGVLKGQPQSLVVDFAIEVTDTSDLIAKAGIYSPVVMARIVFRNGSNSNDILPAASSCSAHATNGFNIQVGTKLLYANQGGSPVVTIGAFKNGAGQDTATVPIKVGLRLVHVF
ncbi:tail fiber protein [Citrobacter phage SH2]|uniref:Tail fiber protein n=1 Tax=Citrobacter phage SH2 TaxID=1805465 RepID=A0A172JG79_9CAUD|nr:tail fiber protein [Citrobacter phage SH2]AMR59495.1 tail fiber protein [Citrobacter phage SH2]